MQRTFIGMVVTYIVMQCHSMSPVLDLTSGHGATVFQRGIFDIVGYFGFHYALTLIPISLVTIFDQTNPFWTSLLSVWILKE